METGEPPYSGGDNCSNDGGTIAYSLGFYFIFLLFVFILCYASYICDRRLSSRLSPPTTTHFATTSDGADDYHVIGLPQGLCDDVLSTFPTFLYSEVVMPESDTNIPATKYCSGCAICLVDYKPPDVLRLLPECSHLFHLSCIDTWLKVHPTCPVCRKSFDFSE